MGPLRRYVWIPADQSWVHLEHPEIPQFRVFHLLIIDGDDCDALDVQKSFFHDVWLWFRLQIQVNTIYCPSIS